MNYLSFFLLDSETSIANMHILLHSFNWNRKNSTPTAFIIMIERNVWSENETKIFIEWCKDRMRNIIDKICAFEVQRTQLLNSNSYNVSLSACVLIIGLLKWVSHDIEWIIDIAFPLKSRKSNLIRQIFKWRKNKKRKTD